MSPLNQRATQEAVERPLDAAVSLALHRAAGDLTRTATSYDLRRDGLEVLDRLADLCRMLDEIATDVWREALSAARTAQDAGEDPLEVLRVELCDLLRTYSEGLSRQRAAGSGVSGSGALPRHEEKT